MYCDGNCSQIVGTVSGYREKVRLSRLTPNRSNVEEVEVKVAAVPLPRRYVQSTILKAAPHLAPGYAAKYN